MRKNQEVIEKLWRCVDACEYCADSCLDENDIKMMVPCIRLDRACAEVCATTARLLSSNSPHGKHLLSRVR